MKFSTMGTKTWMAGLAMSTMVAAQQDPVLITDGCPPLEAGSPPVRIGEVCPAIVAGNFEVTVSVTDENCALTETHICNMSVEQFSSSTGARDYTYSIDTKTAYDFTCGIGEEGTYVVAGHATVECTSSEEPLSAYYELEIGCPPDLSQEETTTLAPTRPAATTTAPVRTRATTAATTAATTEVPTTPLGNTIIGNPLCTNTCDAGQYVTEACGCSPVNKPCDACPVGTRCQSPDSKTGAELMCIDCECGFCDSQHSSCCSVNARANNCKDESNDIVCNMQFDYYPAWAESGNSCGGVEVTKGDPKNGCGCKPNSNTPCTYDKKDVTEFCYVCSLDDLFDPTKNCGACKPCLEVACEDSCFTAAQDADGLQVCLNDSKNDDCRKTCADSCYNIVS